VGIINKLAPQNGRRVGKNSPRGGFPRDFFFRTGENGGDPPPKNVKKELVETGIGGGNARNINPLFLLTQLGKM